MGANTQIVTDESWTTDVLESDTIVLVDFWAEWCGPCRKVAPILDQIAAEVTDVKIVKLNIDENPKVARDYGIQSIPTLSVFKGGEVVQSMLGVRPKAAILSMLEASR